MKMTIRYEHTIQVARNPQDTFALLDNLPLTPQWLEPCTALVKLTPGPNEVGDKLKYSYSQSGHSGEMEGEIVTRIPSEKLTCRYADAMFEVVIDFNMREQDSGTQLTHVITMTPKTMMGKMIAPMIKMGVPKQTHNAMESIKAMLEQ